MNPFDWLHAAVDPFLIAPYRWLANPFLAWWLGTFVLCLWAALLGELTLAAAFRINRFRIEEKVQETGKYHSASLKALKSGDKKSYKAINKLANESFGQTFFLQIAMGMGSLWPAFLAAGWLQERFGEVRFPLPGLESTTNFVPGFILLYILARLTLSRIKKRFPAIQRFLTGL
ncbi:MAG: hypothetical protein JRJ59_10415 [Deltaproteobacteria bacterium]|nr:hypothetical protein [Deltaproteobacteria bacterium]